MQRRVLLLGNFLSAKRQHRHYCEDLAERLEAAGWQVTRASTRVARIARLADMASVIWRQRNEYDVAHVDVYSGLAFSWAELVTLELARLGKPFVVTMHGGSLPTFARQWPHRARRLFARAAAVTSPSDYLREQMRDFTRDVVVVPNGLDTSRYHFRLREHVGARLVWVRAFHRVYNPVMAVEVLARLCADRPDTTLRMIGPDRKDGSLEAVRRRARELGVEGQLDLVGPVANSNIPAELARADVFLNTASTDNAPISVLEAMATGLCVVSTRVGGIPYLVEHERHGLLVPAGSSGEAARAIQRLHENPELARSLSQHARTRALEYDWPVVIAQWNTLFASVVARA